jgi:hypothetical protein
MSIIEGVYDQEKWKAVEPEPTLLILYSSAIIRGQGKGDCPVKGVGYITR